MKRQGALYLLASWRDGCNRGIIRAHGFIIEQLRRTITQFFLLLFGLPLFTYLGAGARSVGRRKLVSLAISEMVRVRLARARQSRRWP